MKNTIKTKLDWNDRIGLQDRFTLEEKGWKVHVDWRSTPYGAGLFSKQDIEAGTILRRGILGVNLKEFTSIADIDEFCRSGEAGKGDDDDNNNNSGYKAKLDYVKDYLWGFNRDADDRGYDKTESPPPDDSRFFGMWIPGNGLNHNETPNTVYIATAEGIDLVALVDIKEDDELFDDYRRHGTSSPWLKEFASIHSVTLNFADCNDFV
jgi:hypothetical protein